jgi:quercetin 2,3-dioxygenase
LSQRHPNPKEKIMSEQRKLYERSVERLVRGVDTSDGAGVRLTRVLTRELQRRLDPYLMLDAFRNEDAADYIGGFPDHPHRGFETITYMIAGRMRHHDSAGNAGLLESGGMQWMRAGSGLIHSELPEQEEGLMEGFQLWLNLPAAEKMTAPAYRDVAPADIPEYVGADGVRVRVLAGRSGGVDGIVHHELTQPLYLDIHLPAGTAFVQPLDSATNAFTYTYRGAVRIGGTTVPDRYMALLANDGGNAVRVEADVDACLILVAGRPLGEAIAQYGPFVMNSDAEIEQAIHDYRSGLFEAQHVGALR